jgi:hypothetical protein
MKLNEYLQALFLEKGSLFQQGAQLDRGHQRLKEAFDAFANHLVNCKSDPEFFKKGVKVDIQALDKNLVTLTTFAGDEIRICLEVRQEARDVRGEVTCIYLRGWDLAKRGEQAKRRILGSWKLEENGDTNIKLPDGAPLNMNAAPEAIALAVGVFLATYSVEEVEDA